jgi:3-hydroxypropanoate dehydrogenase
MSGFDAEGLDADLFADRPWKSLVVVNIGRPAENAWAERLPRLEHDEVFTSL